MEAFFLDTSALSKRYRWEEDSAAVEGLFARQAGRYIAEVTLLEVVNNLRRLLDVDRRPETSGPGEGTGSRNDGRCRDA